MSTSVEVADFRGQVRGTVIEPGEALYDQARAVYNAMIDRRPAIIVKCVDVADVISAVAFGRAIGKRICIRSGGHNAGGLSICDEGFVIDLSGIRYVHVNPAERQVRVGGGNVWGEVDHAAHAFGLAVPSGIISTTGVGGLTLGGGIGHLTRKYGLTIDNLISADMVLADGSFVTASEKENSDLFWAIRGGGGNFGIVTSFLFKAHPVSTVYAGPTLWEMDDAADVMKWYRDFIVKAPEELNGFFAFMTVPPGPPFPEHLHLKKMCGVVWCYCGPMEKAKEVFEPVHSFRAPALELMGEMPFPALQSMFDGLYPPGHHWYWKADFLHKLPDEAIEHHLAHGAALPTMQSTMHLYPINGAASRPKKEDTAWAYRDANWAEVIVGVDPDPANCDAITSWAKGYFDAVHPFSEGGAYVNFMMDEGDERIRATYRDNYDRLAKIKAKYDPENVFNVNQNIRPAASA